jgi:Pyridoxamine 5'-phosphate oxidase
LDAILIKSKINGGRDMEIDLKEYFDGANGTGVLATADGEGRVDTAIYAKPHVMDKETVAFIMAERLTRHNLQTNNHAAYLFREEGQGYKGIRLFLTKLKEEKDTELLYSIRSKRYAGGKEEGKPRFLVFFKVDKILPLVGAERDPEKE